MKTRSLRTRTFVVVVLVVLAPLLLVFVADRLGAREADDMRSAVEEARSRADQLLRNGESSTNAAEDAAKVGRVRVMFLDATDHVLASRDHDGDRSLRDRIGDAMFGPNGAPDLHSYDVSRGESGRWVEVQSARREGLSTGCEIVLSGSLSVCHAASLSPSGQIVLAQKSSPRAIRALADLRYALLKLTLLTLILAVSLALWLSRRIALPVERLRDAVIRRTTHPLESSPIPVVSKDEIGELGKAFNTLVEMLRNRNRSNEAFAADLAHQLKSPILAIRASLESLKPGLSEDRVHRITAIVKDSTTRLDTVVSRLLDLARAESGLSEAKRERIPLIDLIRGINDAFARDERYKTVSFDLETQGHPEVVVAASAFEEALRNVFDNAASFSLRKEPSWVRTRVWVEDGRAVVEMTDSGPGIPKENLDRVFERFFTDRPDGRGTGLGLAFTKAVIEAHGGEVRAQNAATSGASIVASLPLAPVGSSESRGGLS